MMKTNVTSMTSSGTLSEKRKQHNTLQIMTLRMHVKQYYSMVDIS